LHANLDDKGAARLYARTRGAIDSLFSPLIGRLDAIDRVLAVTSPGAPERARLLAWSSDPRALEYFFATARGRQWLDLLGETALLDPGERGWLALPFLERLAAEAPDVVADRLDRQTAKAVRASPEVVVLYSTEELQELPPVEAATRIGSWRPTETGSSAPTTFGLADVLRQVVHARPAPWQDAPIEIISALRHPISIAAYLNALVQLEAPLETDAGPALASAAVFAARAPWPPPPLLQLVHDLGPPAGTEWRAVRSSAVLLIRRLWRETHGLGDAQPAAWTLVTAAVHDRADEPHASGRDAIDGALNRPSMRALDACIALAVQQVRVGQPIPPAFLDLLDETLELDGPDGLHARAVIAQRLGWLHDAAPHWFASRQERLIGSAAPDDLGQQTWDLYIAWGSHSAHLLEAFPDRYLDALARQQQAALPRILTGILWGVASWADVPQTVQRLADIDPQWVSRGAEELGHSLQTSHDPPSLPVNAWRYWQAALAATLPSGAFPGFGWYAQITLLDQDDWLTMTEQTLARSGGGLDWADSVARRAAKSTHDPRALRIITALLRHPADPWDILMLVEVGHDLLVDSAGPLQGHPARSALRTVLVERGDYRARDAP
jgi:hypothetical protein